MADNINNYFQLIAGQRDTPVGGTSRATNKIICSPKDPSMIVDVFNHRIFANDINDTLKNKLPFVFIEEYSLVTNSLINQFRYFADLTTSIGATIPGQVVQGSAEYLKDTNWAKNIWNSITGVAESITSSAVGKSITDFTQTAADTTLNAIRNQLPKLPGSKFNEALIGPALSPYDGLYQVEPTGFRYIMPYFEDKHYDINNKFVDNFTGFLGSETETMKYAPNVFKMGTELIRKVSESFLSYTPGAYSAPSTYVEVPQYFASGDYETVTVKFDLLNTFNKDDLQKNYDLLFLLAFQNLPYREDIVRISPPKIYTLYIPGQMYLPFCNIKSIKVDYVGNRRILNLKKYSYQTDGVNSTDQSVIVPDCYRVSIEFISMVKPAANFMIVPQINSTVVGADTTIRSAEQTLPPQAPTSDLFTNIA